MALNLLGKKSNTDLGGLPDTDDAKAGNDEAEAPIGETDLNAGKTKKGRKGRGRTEDGKPDLSRLKKKELLEILVAQSEEIDALRAQILAMQQEQASLEAKLADHEFQMKNVGSIAQASLQVTDIFKEAEKAARIYLENIRRRYV